MNTALGRLTTRGEAETNTTPPLSPHTQGVHPQPVTMDDVPVATGFFNRVRLQGIALGYVVLAETAWRLRQIGAGLIIAHNILQSELAARGEEANNAFVDRHNGGAITHSDDLTLHDTAEQMVRHVAARALVRTARIGAHVGNVLWQSDDAMAQAHNEFGDEAANLQAQTRQADKAIPNIKP
ncbi:MAG TPA: hypothetical protein VN778_01530 [Verrucomicrobiae bacterium]|nr:hypothetical protein [Verrucomicrobiae bacterium]